MLRTYNTFWKGIASDDFLTNGPGIIDSKNIDGVSNGYGAILGPKTIKIRTVPETPYCTHANFGTRNFIGTAGGNIYDLDGADLDAPLYTFAGGDAVVRVDQKGGQYYFHTKDITNYGDHRIRAITSIDLGIPDYTSLGTNVFTLSNQFGQNSYSSKSYIYFGGLGSVYTATGDVPDVTSSFSLVSGYVVGITSTGTQFKVYARSSFRKGGTLTIWEPQASSISATIDLGFAPADVVSSGGIDYITSEAGDLYIGSGYQVQRVSQSKLSSRGNDNSTTVQKLNFAKQGDESSSIVLSRDQVYLKDTNSVYVYDDVIDGLNKGIHRIITQDFNGDDYTKITEIREWYITSNYTLTTGFGPGLFIAGETANNKSICYVPDNSTETALSGYMITDVFAGGTSYTKKAKRIFWSTTNAGKNSNYVKIYARINNGSWEELVTINTGTGITNRDSNVFNREFIDVQFKIELYNSNQQLVDCPIFHELILDYDVIQR